MTALRPERVEAITRALRAADGVALRLAVTDAGFRNPDESAGHLWSLWSLPAFQARTADGLASALQAADPDAALLGLDRFADACAEKIGRPFDFDPASLGLLCPLAGASRFLTTFLTQDPGALARLAASPWLDAEKPREALDRELAGAAGPSPDFEGLQRALRRVRGAEMLRIAARDLTGRADVETVMRELSRLAEASLEVAVSACDAALRRRYGAPWAEGIGGGREEAAFAVIGMGKLGACELNFSSDVDLLYVYSSSRGQTEGGESGERLALHAYYVKLAEQVTRAIGEVTNDGFVFRVDLGLRPDGSRGQLANSITAHEVYYASWGETWERSALLRARFVAGSPRVAEEFLRAIAPIVYRKTLDFGTIEDMRQMKHKIDAEARRRQGQGWDVKIGRGGIREIEFIVQSLQLVHAGRNPVLREKGTLALLSRLKEARMLDEKEVLDLSAAYRFFRTLEHRLQMAEDRQTHLLPTRAGDLERVARSLGFADAQRGPALRAFHDRLETHRARVQAAFGRLLAEGGTEAAEEEEEVDPAVRELMDLSLPPEEERQRLASLGFEDPAGAAARLVWLRDPPATSDLSVRSRRLLRVHSPVFLQEIVRAPDPDRALAHLESFFSSSMARYTLFTVLAAHRETLRLLIRLFGTSDYLSDAFIHHPELLDSLVLSSYATVRRTRVEMEGDIAEALPDPEDFEGRLNAVRRFKRGELLRIAFNDLSGTLDRGEVSAQLSDLAEACLSAALAIGRQEMDERFGPPGDPADPGGVARFALLGMGKLGGREIDYHSDLDIIFVFDPQGETRGGSRGRRISNMEYFVKTAQRIITIMTLRTTEGSLFEIDTRLRPSGNAGPLVTSLESFEQYHAKSAQVWERQALIKARFVAGDAALGDRLEETARRFAYGRPWDASVTREIGRIRARMEKEIARETPDVFNLKTGRGGIADVEFVVQLLQLRHGPGNGALQVPNTPAALDVLRRQGRISAREAEDLETGYTFLRTLEDRLRLLRNRSTSEMESAGPELEKLARRLGYAGRPGRPADAALLAEYREHTERIRAIYERVFGSGGGDEAGAAREGSP